MEIDSKWKVQVGTSLERKKQQVGQNKKCSPIYIYFFEIQIAKCRFSNLMIQKPQRTSWEKKVQLKLEAKNLKERVSQMRQEKK